MADRRFKPEKAVPRRYDPLKTYLLEQKLADFDLSFTKIEEIIGRSLPKSALHPTFWYNLAMADEVSHKSYAWRDAGYKAFLIKEGQRVRFVKQ